MIEGIKIAGGTTAKHVGSVIRASVAYYPFPAVIDTAAGRGCRLLEWVRWCNEQNGIIVVRRLTTENLKNFHAQKFAKYLVGHLGDDYAWSLLWEFARTELPLLRLRWHPVNDDWQEYRGLHVCSTLHAAAMRFAGPDPVCYLADESTSPSDLLMSAAYNTILNVIPDHLRKEFERCKKRVS